MGTKMKDIQETLIKYNETLKEKNEEIASLANIKEEKCKVILTLEETIEQKDTEMNELKLTRERLKCDVEQMRRNIEEMEEKEMKRKKIENENIEMKDNEMKRKKNENSS